MAGYRSLLSCPCWDSFTVVNKCRQKITSQHSGKTCIVVVSAPVKISRVMSTEYYLAGVIEWTAIILTSRPHLAFRRPFPCVQM